MKMLRLESSKTGVRALMVGTFLLVLGIGVGRTQHTGTVPGTVQPGTSDPTDPMGQIQDASGNRPGKGDDTMRGVAERQVKLREEERQKRLVSDTEKLLTLATQLHDDVSKTNKNILSLEVVKRADEIEKLAHSVKEKMRE